MMIRFSWAFSLLALTACSSPTALRHNDPSPETMLITYHVKAGKEAELHEVLSQAWEVYRKEHLVLIQPHTIVRDKEGGGKTRIIEIFSWVSPDAPDHAPDSVRKIWDRMQSLCEARNGREGLELGQVELVAPKR
jgi:hypothetical protein